MAVPTFAFVFNLNVFAIFYPSAIANTSGSSINVGVGITRASADDVNLMKNVPIPQGSSFEFMSGNKVVLETTDTLTAVSDVNNSLDVALTIMEIT